MVDFQSRDTRPTYGGEDDESDAEEPEDVETEEGEGADIETEEGEAAGAEDRATDAATATAPADAADGGATTAGDAESEATIDWDDAGARADESAGGQVAAADSAAMEPGKGATATGSDTQFDTDDAAGAVDDAAAEGPAGFAVVTAGADLSVETDPAGEAALELLDPAAASVATREIIGPKYDTVQQTLGGLVVRNDVDVVVVFGGDGVAPADGAVDAARALFDKELPGFGELFRSRARESIGTGVLRTRACAGTIEDVAVFCLPASADAARLGLEEIVLPEVEPVVAALRS